MSFPESFGVSFSDFENLANQFQRSPNKENTRVILTKDASGLEVEEASNRYSRWEHWTMFRSISSDCAAVRADREVIEAFRKVLEEKYPFLDNTFFQHHGLDPSQRNSSPTYSPLSAHKIEVVLQEAKLKDQVDKETKAKEFSDQKEKELKDIYNKFGNLETKIEELSKHLQQDIPYDRSVLDNETLPEVQSYNQLLSLKESFSGIQKEFNQSFIEFFESYSNYPEQLDYSSSMIDRDLEEQKKRVEQLLKKAKNNLNKYSDQIEELSSNITSLVEIEKSQEEERSNLPPCDDFPAPSLLDKALLDIYHQRAILRENGYNTSLERIQLAQEADLINLEALLPTYHGFVGFSNPTGACAINTSLQLVKVALEEVRDTPAWEGIKARVGQQMPHLLKFLDGELKSEGDLKELRKEVARLLHEDFWYTRFSGRGVGSSQLEHGYFMGAKDNHATAVLLHRLGIPPFSFSREKRNTHGAPGTTHALQRLELLQSSEVTTAAARVSNYLSHHGTTAWRHGQPPSPLLYVDFIDSQFRGVTNALEPIMLKDSDGKEVIYEPVSIGCSYADSTQKEGHAWTFVKKNHYWYEINDADICPIPRSLEQSLQEYCSKCKCTIIYRKKGSGDQAEETAPPSVDCIEEFYQQASTFQRRKEHESFVSKIHQSFLLKLEGVTKENLQQKIDASSTNVEKYYLEKKQDAEKIREALLNSFNTFL